jgi:uncharacterized membrane protein
VNVHAELLRTVDAAPAPARATDSRARSLAKALSYRLFATAVMAAVAWIITHRLAVAAAVAGADSILKTGLFYVHERLWARIGFGRSEDQAETPPPGSWLR